MGIGERLLTVLGFSAMGGLGMGFNMMVMLSALENWEIEWSLVAASGNRLYVNIDGRLLHAQYKVGD